MKAARLRYSRYKKPWISSTPAKWVKNLLLSGFCALFSLLGYLIIAALVFSFSGCAMPPREVRIPTPYAVPTPCTLPLPRLPPRSGEVVEDSVAVFRYAEELEGVARGCGARGSEP